MILVTAQVLIAIFTLSPPHFTSRSCNRDSDQRHLKPWGSFPGARLFPPAFFNYISKVEKLPLAHYYSVSELSLIPDTTNKYLIVGAHCWGAAEGALLQPSQEVLHSGANIAYA